MEFFLMFLLVSIPMWLNIKATLAISRDTFAEKSQRISQLLLVWLLPVFGAIFVLAIHRPAEKSSGTYPADRQLGDDYGYSGACVSKLKDTIDGD